MGNNCTKDYIPKEEFNNISSHQYKPTELNELHNKLNIIDKAKRLNVQLDPDSDFDKNIKYFFTKKYGIFLDIERFAIPIIGVINSGKSTFMNNFLNLNSILQIGDTVTTRFITIIRHDKNAKTPEIYNVEIKRRNNGQGLIFNEKGENLLKKDKNLNIAKKIKEINEDIENNQNTDKYLYDIEKYFLIIRTKVPIFEGEFEEYGNLIDFLDIPGLDEVKELNTNIFDDFIQIIFSNILFPLFIFDVKSFENDNSRNIIIKFLDLYTKIIRNFSSDSNEKYDKGIYILNKIDLVNEDVEVIKKNFISVYSKINITNGKDIEIPLEENTNFFFISANRLLIEKNTNYIDNILEDIISQSKKTKFNSFKKFINDYFSKYNIDLSKANQEDNSLKERLDIINNILKQKCISLNNPKFNLKEFTFLSKINGDKDNETDKKNKLLISKIQQTIKDQLDDFLNFNFEGLILKINMNELQEKEKKIYDNKNIYDKNFINEFNNKALSLFPDKIVEKFENPRNLVSIINDFSSFYKEKNIRIIFIGIVSSGKTSLLNSIIGNNYYILERTINECTKCIYRIKYSSRISFCESKIINNQFGNYFEDIKETEIYDDLEEIKKKIQNLNEKSKFKIYTLYIPIEALENIENKEKIELIDLPGIKKDIAELKIDLKELINMADGFIFNFNSLNIADENSQYIFTQIIGHIKDRSDCFDFKNCLFNLNWIDEIEPDLIEDKIKEFKEILIKQINSRIYTGNFLYKLSIKEKVLSTNNINVSYISNLYYEQYQKIVDEIEYLKFITNGNSLENIYQDLLDEYEGIEKIISQNNLELIYKNKINEKIELIKIKTHDRNENYILKIAKFLVVFPKYKKELIKKYESSKAELFFKHFTSQINSSIQNNEKNIKIKFNNYLIKLLFQLYYYNELCLNEDKIDCYKNNIETKKCIIETEYNQIINIIKIKFSDKIKIIEGYEENVISLLTNNERLSKEEIMEKIKSLGIENKINKIMNYFHNEIRKIELDFYFFCIKEISELLNMGNFSEILEKICLAYKGNNRGIKIAGAFFGTMFISSTLGFILGTSELSIGLSILGISYSGIGLAIVIPFSIYYIYQHYKSNTKKINDYFEEVKKQILIIQKKYIKAIEDKKKKFIQHLKKTNNISLKEIKDLKEVNYQYNFQEFIKLFT